MELITTDTADFMNVEPLKEIVFRAIEAGCELEYFDQPHRVPKEAEIRKQIVRETLAILEGYEDSQKVMLKAYLKHFTGERL